MLPDFELRFVKRIVSHQHEKDIGITKQVNILQYRTGEPDTTYDYTRWSKWQDIPVVTESEADEW